MSAEGEILDLACREIPDLVALGLFRPKSGALVAALGLDEAHRQAVSQLAPVARARMDVDDPLGRALLAPDDGLGATVSEVLVLTPRHLCLALTLPEPADLGFLLLLEPRSNLGLSWTLARGLPERLEPWVTSLASSATDE